MVAETARESSAELVGRVRELDLLDGHLGAMAATRGGAVVVIGEPGIGKTALASAIAQRERAAGALVLWGRCSALGGQATWGPISQALGALLDARVIDPAMVAACGGGLLAILPEVERLAPELVAPAGADPDTIAFGVARAASRLLRQVCLQSPCLLVIDDVHDADRGSLRLLARLAQEARTMPLHIVLTAREGELAASKYRIEIEDLSRDVAFVRVGALDHDASRALISRIAPGLGGDLADRVLAVADGNPLYLRELAALMAARSSTPSGELPIPVGVRASIRSRLERLPAGARACVDALAVLGGHAPLDRIALIARVPVAAFTAATDVGIAIPVGPGAARLSHALVREVAYAELADLQRGELHRRAAADAAERAGSSDHDAAIEHVRHLAACGAAGEAIEAAVLAARGAELRAADDEAVSLLEVADTAADASGVDDRHRAELAIALGRARLRCGRSHDGVASCERASILAERLGDVDLVARAALARGSVFRYGHVDRGLVRALQRAVELRPSREDAVQARLLARLAAAEQPSLEPRRPIARAHEAFALAHRLGDEVTLLDVLHDGMAACVDVDDPRERIRHDQELRELARRQRAPWYELRALNRLVFDHVDVGSVEAADADIEDLDAVARSFAHPRHMWRVAMLRAMRALSEGRWAAVDRHTEEAIALGGDDPLQPLALFGQRWARLRAQGRAEELVQLIDDERDLLVPIPESNSIISLFRASSAGRAGDLATARKLLPLTRGCLPFGDVCFMTMFAEVAVTLADREACAFVEPMLASRVHRFVSGGPMFMYVADPMERFVGLVAAQLGDRPRALVHLESALARLRQARSEPYIARTALDLAGLLAAGTAAEQARAAELRAEAAELAERLELVDLRAARRPDAAAPSAPFVPASPGFTLVADGDAWTVTSHGRTFRLRDTRGLRILSRLIEHAGVDVHVLDLVEGDGVIDRGDAGALLDPRAQAEYRARLVDLREDLAEAERRSDLGWIDRLRTESEMVQAELARAFGKGGRARRSGAAAERARSAVTRRVREAIARIGEHDKAVGEHLEWAVRTGITCSYREKPA